jgi:hypothetical protein
MFRGPSWSLTNAILPPSGDQLGDWKTTAGPRETFLYFDPSGFIV